MAAEAEARARGGVLEAGEHPPVHEEEEGDEGAPAEQPARAPLRPAPPPGPGGGRGARRGQRRREQPRLGHRRIRISGGGSGNRASCCVGGCGVELWCDRCGFSELRLGLIASLV